MIEPIPLFSIRNRVLVVLLTAALGAFGVYSLRNLPIDAVPDVTNNQVQINALAPALSPTETENLTEGAFLVIAILFAGRSS